MSISRMEALLVWELRLIRRLPHRSLRQIASEDGVTPATVRDRIRRTADRLDALGLDGSVVRQFARQRLPRARRLTEVRGGDVACCLRHLAWADLTTDRPYRSAMR